jgi:hypothetical protein
VNFLRLVTAPARAFWNALGPEPYRTRLAYALGLSFWIHALILAIKFGVGGFGFPDFELPWAERPAPPPNLTVRLTEVAPPDVAPRLQMSNALANPPKGAPRANKAFDAELASAAPATPPAPLSAPRRETRAPAPAAKARAAERKVRRTPAPRILAQNKSQPDAFTVPRPKRAELEPQRAPESAARKQTEEAPPATQPAEQIASAQAQEDARKTEDAARQRAEETARQEAEELARQRALALQKEQEAKKIEEARRLEEIRKQEEAKAQAELKKQEEAKRLTLQTEALKRAEDAARLQAEARRKEQEAKRQAEEAAARAKEVAERKRMEDEAAGRRERDRLAGEQPPGAAPGALPGSELAAKAIDQLRNPATRGDLLRPPGPPATIGNPRRRSLFGVERDVSLRMYVDSWRWKIERNGVLNYRASASWRVHEPPIVTVSIRSDGSLEDVLIHRSSGIRELDDAVRRIARLQAPYSAFPPDLARQYDVIEIRRVWSFENTLRILDEM